MSNFSSGLDFAWQTAASEAALSRHEFIEPEHLFVGICKLGNLASVNDWVALKIPVGAAALLKREAELVVTLFSAARLDRISLYREIRKLIGVGSITDTSRRKISRSATSRRLFERATAIAAETVPVTSLHLLLALIDDESGRCVEVLKEKGVDISPFKRDIFAQVALPALQPAQESQSFLSHFGKDLTRLARDGKIQPCIGRRDELLQIIRALSRETKSNPLLLGDAGVGKTAIVEGLAWRISQNKDAALAGKRLVQLNVADLVAGASSRGDFEARMQGILREVAASPDVILFIDEIHSLVGAGAGSGPLDAANIMKPALARGEVEVHRRDNTGRVSEIH